VIWHLFLRNSQGLLPSSSRWWWWWWRWNTRPLFLPEVERRITFRSKATVGSIYFIDRPLMSDAAITRSINDRFTWSLAAKCYGIQCLFTLYRVLVVMINLHSVPEKRSEYNFWHSFAIYWDIFFTIFEARFQGWFLHDVVYCILTNGVRPLPDVT